MRKASEVNDFDDGDYSEDDDVDFEEENHQPLSLLPSSSSLPTISTTLRTTMFNSLITKTRTTTATTLVKITTNHRIAVMESKSSDNKLTTPSCATSHCPLFIYLSFSFSFLYRFN